MALVLADRVKETTNTTGTGAISLSGAATGFQSFVDTVGDGNTTYYAVSSALGSEFEVGIGTYTQSSDELSRDTVLASSNGGSLVDFSAGTKDVYVVYPADKAVYKDESGVVPATTFSSVALTSGTVTSQPTTSNGIANKAYVDEVAQGLRAKPADDVATTSNLDATYDNGTSGVGATLTANSNGAFPTIDGYDMSVGETILVKDQTDPLENGSYELTDAGSSTTPWVLTRATLVDETDEVQGAFEFVINGTTLAGSGFVATVPEDFLIGSSDATSDPNGFTQRGDIVWVQFSGAGTFTAGTGLALDGTEFSLQKLGIEDLSDPNADRILFWDDSAGNAEWLSVGSNLTLSGTTLSADQQAPTAGTAIDVSGTTVSLDLSELTTSTSNADGDFFVVVDDANAQRKLAKGSINVSEFNNDAGYTSGNDTITLSGDVTGSGTTSISVTVQDDSHNHIISNVDGLQDALDNKVPTSRTITAGTGLSGGGNLTADRTLGVDLNELSSSTSNADGDFFVVVDSADGSQHKLTKSNINVGGFNNDAGYLTQNETITLGGDVTGSGRDSITVSVNNDSHSHTGSTISGLGTSNFAGSALQTSAEGFTDSNTIIMTAAAVNDRIESFGYSTTDGTVTSVSVSAGTGLGGGGTVTSSGTISLNVDLNELGSSTSNSDGDFFAVVDSADGSQHKLSKGSINISGFNNDAGFTSTTANNASITINAGSQLTGGGTFTTDQSFNETITVDHGNTSGLSGTYGSTSNATKIDNITVDANGHVTGITTGATGDIAAVTAGSGLTGGGSSGSVTLNHADTSSQGSVNNSGGTVIQDVTLDGFGHVTNLNSVNLDGRYLGASDKAADSNLLDGLNSSQFLRSDTGDTINVGRGDVYIENNSGDNQDGAGITIRTSSNPGSGSEGSVGSIFAVRSSGQATRLWVGQTETSTGGNNFVTRDITANGAITATGDITAHFSDDRLKTKLGVIEDALGKINSLEGFYYEPNDTAVELGYERERMVGVSAQSVQNVLPEAVKTAPVSDEYLTVQYEKLVPILVEAIKTLSARVDELESKR